MLNFTSAFSNLRNAFNSICRWQIRAVIKFPFNKGTKKKIVPNCLGSKFKFAEKEEVKKSKFFVLMCASSAVARDRSHFASTGAHLLKGSC